MIRHKSLDADPITINRVVYNNKLGRNDKCWCGSGNKFKHCHLGRSEQDYFNPFVHITDIRRRHLAGKCKYPIALNKVCGKDAILSHTIQKGGGLSAIAEQSHVLTLKFDFSDLSKTGGNPQPKKIGLSKASAFPLFCPAHDSAAFRSIEAKNLTLTRENAFLFAYRALNFELFLKEKVIYDLEDMRSIDRGQTAKVQGVIQDEINLMIAGNSLALQDLQKQKRIYDAKYIARDFADVHYACVEFDRVLPLVVSCTFFPEYDFSGVELQRLSSNTPIYDHLSLTITNFGGHSFCIFAWTGFLESQSLAFVESLLSIPNSDKAGRLVDACFVISENTFIKPSWWLEQPDFERRRLLRLYEAGTPSQDRSSKDLRAGHRFASTPVAICIEKSW